MILESNKDESTTNIRRLHDIPMWMDERYVCMQHAPLPMQDAMSWVGAWMTYNLSSVILECQWFTRVVKNFPLEVKSSCRYWYVYIHMSQKSVFFFKILYWVPTKRMMVAHGGLWKRPSKDGGCSRRNESGRVSRPHTCPRAGPHRDGDGPFFSFIHLCVVRSYTHTLPSFVLCRGFKRVLYNVKQWVEIVSTTLAYPI